MVRIIIAAVAGAVVYFIWQMLAWMALPIHGPTVAKLKNENAVRDALVAQDLDDGVYIIPFPGEGEDMFDPESETSKRHLEGPLVSIFYTKAGEPPMPPRILIVGFVTDFLGALIAAGLLSCCACSPKCQGYLAKVGVVTSLGIFLALMSHVAYYNWMRFEAHYSAMFVLDVVVGWFLVGLVQAAIVKPEAAK